MNHKIRIGMVIVAAFGFVAGALAQEWTPRVRPKAYGTAQDSIYHVPITEFVPSDSGTSYYDQILSGTVARYSFNCFGRCLYAIPRLPNGALLTAIEAYFCNTDLNPADALGVELYNSLYDGTVLTDLGVGAYTTSHNGCGEIVITDLTSLNYQVNYYNNQLILFADIGELNGTQAIAGVNLFYRLQVSPAPPTSDFNDAPTTSAQFQFIEALYASGITAGCGSGNYCPNNPVTRGQMAVFLAKALGLQWP